MKVMMTFDWIKDNNQEVLQVAIYKKLLDNNYEC